MSLFFKRHPETKEKIGHIIAGVIILVHAYEKFDLHESSYIFFLIAGLVFLSVAVFHHRLAKRFLYVDGVFFVIEGILNGIIAANYFHKGKKALPWCYVFVAIMYGVVAVIRARKGKEKYLKKQYQ
jgi:uncharacterized membrane protein YobD (UPF0266 family)